MPESRPLSRQNEPFTFKPWDELPDGSKRFWADQTGDYLARMAQRWAEYAGNLPDAPVVAGSDADGQAAASSPAPEPSTVVEHAGQIKTRLYPLPGEVWLQDGDEMPVIVTSVTWGRVSFIRPQADSPGYRESYTGGDYWFGEDWTRLWPPEGRRARDGG